MNTNIYDVGKSPFDLCEHTIYVVRSGSRAHGTHTPHSDYDVRGVFVSPTNRLLGLRPIDDLRDALGNVVHQSLGLYVARLAASDVEALETLHAPDDCILRVETPMERFLRNRHEFLTADLARTFENTAFSIIRRIRAARDSEDGKPKFQESSDYNTKSAAHTVRILRMGAEALESGQLIVRRFDSAELRAIRDGAFAFEDFVRFASQHKGAKIVGGIVHQEINRLRAAAATTRLPSKISADRVDKMLTDTYLEIIESRHER